MVGDDGGARTVTDADGGVEGGVVDDDGRERTVSGPDGGARYPTTTIAAGTC
jgi:hypothetical protein